MPQVDYTCVFYYDKKTNYKSCDEDFSCLVTYNYEDRKTRIYERNKFECAGNTNKETDLSDNYQEYEIKGTFINSPYNVRFEFKNENQKSDKFYVYYIIRKVSNDYPRCLTSDRLDLTTRKSDLGRLDCNIPAAIMCFDMVDICKSIIQHHSNYLMSPGDNELRSTNTALERVNKFSPSCVNERNDIGFSEISHGRYDKYYFQLMAKFCAQPRRRTCQCEHYIRPYDGCCYIHHRIPECCPGFGDYYIQIARLNPSVGINFVKEMNEDTRYSDKFVGDRNTQVFQYNFFTTTCPQDLIYYRIPRRKLREGMRIPIVGGEYLEKIGDREVPDSLKISRLTSWPGIKGCVLLVPKDSKGGKQYQIFPCTSENNQYENFEFNNKLYGAIRFSFNSDINETTTDIDSISSKYFIKKNVPIITKEEVNKFGGENRFSEETITKKNAYTVIIEPRIFTNIEENENKKNFETNESITKHDIKNEENIIKHDIKNEENIVKQDVKNQESLTKQDVKNEESLTKQDVKNEESLTKQDVKNEENITKQDVKNDENIVKHEFNNQESLTKQDVKNQESLTKQDVKKEEIFNKKNVGTEENIVKHGVKNEENIVKHDVKNEENIVKHDVKNQENITKQDVKNQGSLIKQDVKKEEIFNKKNVGTEENIVKHGVKTEESIVKKYVETEESINKKIKENSDLLDLINKKIHYIESHINRTVEDKSEQEALEKINKDIKSIEKNLQEELKRTNELSSKAMEKNKEEIFDTYNKIHNELIEIKEKVKKEEKVISKNESDKRSYSGNSLITNNTLHINKDDDLKYRVKNDYHFSNNNFYLSNSHHRNISNGKEIGNERKFVIEKDSDMRETKNVTNSVQSDNHQHNIFQNSSIHSNFVQSDNVEIKNITDESKSATIQEESEIKKEKSSEKCSPCKEEEDDVNKATIYKLEEDDCIKKENVNKIVDGNMNFGKSVIGGGAFMDLDDYQYKDYVLSQTTEGENYTENYCFLPSRQCPDYSNETLLTSSSSSIHRNYSAGGIMLLIIFFCILKRIFIK